MLNIRPIEAFSDNYIWLITADEHRQAFVVDPGDATVVEQALAAEELDLVGILITHHHFDHVGGLAELKAAHQPLVYGPDNPAIEGIDRRVTAGDRVDVLGQSFSVMEVPGHTLDHIAYFAGGDTPLLFCGDTLFAGGCGRLFEGTAPMMHRSLQSLMELPASTRVYCAHEYTLANLAFAQAVEPDNEALARRMAEARAARDRGEATVPSTLALERATNPFVRCDSAELQAALQAQQRLEDASPAAVFATVRAWKDNF
ncbi:hydroxyacylglutathione hydrolase [Seongchinamella sediminis]|uniref:Hydroxyacylglutathione hydrolase n=1 Tax=Seongchinamella sediminis TaxID=2283635 RepID=A0A3L7E3G4_9GAMM|nr:hydroxyacylglutathione hydrolase [Seongchinamella sediminis]RLQ22951.1 hydroxyacylglutathione hydrolase [Seongchinamella sediminis]